MGVHVGATWRKQFNDTCLTTMHAVTTIAVARCYCYRALLSSTVDQIPSARLDDLRQIVRRFYGVEQIDSALIQQAASLDTRYILLFLSTCQNSPAHVAYIHNMSLCLYFSQKSSDGSRKAKARPLIGFLLQCFDTDGWVAGKTSGPWNPNPFIARGSF